MSTLAQIAPLIQPACYAKLLSEVFFSNIAIFPIKEKRLDSEVFQALQGIAGRNGKGGARYVRAEGPKHIHDGERDHRDGGNQQSVNPSAGGETGDAFGAERESDQQNGRG